MPDKDPANAEEILETIERAARILEAEEVTHGQPTQRRVHEPKACASCGAAIYWAQTEAGRSMPVDADPHPEGNVVLADRDGSVVTRIVKRGQQLPHGAKLRRPHWATCPHADKWRRSNG